MLFMMAVRHIHTIEILDTERTDSDKRDRNWCTSEVSCEHTYSKDYRADHETEPNITGLPDNDGDDVSNPLLEQRIWWTYLVEKKYFRQFFRSISVANLIVLVLSIPIYNLTEIENNEKKKQAISIQFKIITGLDFLLACLYTFHIMIRLGYYIHTMKKKKQKLVIHKHNMEKFRAYNSWYRLSASCVLTMTMWYSVAIGIYRSTDPTIHWGWYLGFVPRAILAVFPVLDLTLRVESSAIQGLSEFLKWKQLAMVTVFYFIFVFLFALMGVHIIGGLNYACVHKMLQEDGSYIMAPALPLTHCSPDNKDVQFFCGENGDNISGLVCARFPPRRNESDLLFDYRSYVYFGQFTVILDALYAVYEASTLELWSFMMYTAIEGRGVVLPVLFYFFLVLFIVVILQQSIFLVVIIESFADLRDSDTLLWKAKSSDQKTQSKPTVVLALHDNDEFSNDLRIVSLEQNETAHFLKKYSRFLVKFEKIFLVLVIIDATVTATKHAEVNPLIQEQMRIVLQTWQVTVSVLFVIEIAFLFFFHLYHGQWKLFLRRPYYLCLVVLAVGGLVAALPLRVRGFYDPLLPGSGLAIFQALRFPRLLRLSQAMLEFTLKILGKSIPILSVITIAIICWLTVFNAQIFGYMTEFPKECSRVGGQQFGTFLEAFVSTFQLVLNEAWTDVTSEVMCRSKLWFVSNFYFIVIHLFSSLIFLNFFGAVILDNLEYDEEEKKIKLEDLKKRKEKFAETVPLHLKIFGRLNNQPKMLKPPLGVVGADPKLKEFEVQKFFDSTCTSNQIEDPKSLHDTGHTHIWQQSFEGTSGDVMQSAMLGDYHTTHSSVSAILNYISLWRKFKEAENSRTSHSSNIHYHFGYSSHGQKKMNHTSSDAQNIYDELREKHRYFDAALFCMPPEHKLRRICTWLLKAQAEVPEHVHIEGKGEILQLLKRQSSFFLKWIIGRMPYSTWIMFVGLWTVITIQLNDFQYSSSELLYRYNLLVEVIYLLLLFSWLILKIISYGCFINPHAAINSAWDIMDWILVLHSAVLLALLPLWFTGDYQWLSIKINIAFLPYWAQYLFIIRSLRPLHALSMFTSLRAVVKEIIEGWRNLLKAVIIMSGFIFMFASLGVQLFSGTKENPLAFCNDPRITSKNSCTGNFWIELETSREFLPLNNSVFPTIRMMVPRVWYSYARDFPFNHVGTAFVTLFELLTLEGWPEVRGLFEGRDSTIDFYMGIYMHTFVFFAVNTGLQLFLGIVVNNFNEHKPGHSFLLSVEQNRWTELMQRVSLQRPYKLPQEPRHHNLRLRVYNFLTHRHFHLIPTVTLALCALTLVVPWDERVITLEGIQTVISVSAILNLYSILEMFLKLLAFGAAYFQSWRNILDFVLSLATFVYCFVAFLVVVLPLSSLYKNVSYFALGLAILKLLTVMFKYSPMLNLLLTVGSTMVRSFSLVQVLFIVFLCYALLGVTFFGNVRSGEAIDYNLVNFKGINEAMISLLRSLTGEDWYQIMWDAAVRPPYCQDSLNNCGSPITSVLYFCSFTFIVPFILLNVFIAVLLENFSIFYNDEETNLDKGAMKDFKRQWRLFDLNARGHIPIRRVKLLLRSLSLDTYYTYSRSHPGQKKERVRQKLIKHSLLLWEMEEELRREVLSSLTKTRLNNESLNQQNHQAVLESSEINVKFLNVLRMLAYRCEDIHKRLESQELFGRGELEQALQLDVAKECIQRWLRKRVKIIFKHYHVLEVQRNFQTQSLPQPVSVKRKQFSTMHKVHSPFLDVGIQRLDTEDEAEGELRRQNFLQTATSEEEINYVGIQEDSNQSCSSRSFNKLKQRFIPNRYEKAREWFQMQNEWMDKVGTNQDYFDDYL